MIDFPGFDQARSAYYIIVFLYIALVIGSAGMVASWVPALVRVWWRQAPAFRALDAKAIVDGGASLRTRIVSTWPLFGTCHALRWSQPFQITVSIVEHAVFMAIASIFRTAQLLIDGQGIIGRGDIILIIVLLGLGDSKRRLVRAGSIAPDRKMRWPWYVFNAILVMCALGVAYLAIFTEIGYVRP